MATRLREPLLKFRKGAFRKTRLIDFPTGQSTLLDDHRAWVAETARAIPFNRNFHIYIFGYASKLGYQGMDQRQSDAANVALSYRRASQVAKLMESVNTRVTTHIDSFLARGNQDYFAEERDDSGMWRAVEVFVFLDDIPPPPPGIETPPPCPGGNRFRKWAIATPGGASFSPVPGAVIAGNLAFFRKGEGAPTIHGYFAPGVGPGVSYSGTKLKGILDTIKGILGNFDYMGMSWSDFIAETPFNFNDLDGASCLIKSAGAGVIVGYTAARVSVYGQIWFRETSGKCMFATKDFFIDVVTSGKELRLGAGASPVGGPLIRIS